MPDTRLADARLVEIPSDGEVIAGDLDVPAGAKGLVIFAHGSGSGRTSPRNMQVAGRLRRIEIATLMVDLLTEKESAADATSGVFRFDIELLARRVESCTRWALRNAATAPLQIGYYGASTGAAAVLTAASRMPEAVKAVVSRGGRPDLAMSRLRMVRAATLLIVGGRDAEVIHMNRAALTALSGEKRLEIIPGAGHLFEEPGALESVSDLAADWFGSHFER